MNGRDTNNHPVWIDAQLPTALATWLKDTFDLDAFTLCELGLRDAEDSEIYNAAKAADAILISKDGDFVDLVQRFGMPPKLIWVTCGDVSNANLRAIFLSAIPIALELLATGEPIVEVR